MQSSPKCSLSKTCSPLFLLMVLVTLVAETGCSVLDQHDSPPSLHPSQHAPASSSSPDAGKRVKASFYGGGKSGQKLSKKTASGEPFDASDMTAAHRTLPFGTKVKLCHPTTGKEVTVRVNDRGPFVKDREIDISRAAAEQVGMVDAGVQQLDMTVEKNEE